MSLRQRVADALHRGDVKAVSELIKVELDYHPLQLKDRAYENTI
jgi:hypothetical protein